MIKKGDFIKFYNWFLIKHKKMFDYSSGKCNKYADYGSGPFEVVAIYNHSDLLKRDLITIKFKIFDGNSRISLGGNDYGDKTSFFDWGCPFEVVKDENNLQENNKSITNKYNSVCNRCGSPAYVGLFDVECSNPNC